VIGFGNFALNDFKKASALLRIGMNKTAVDIADADSDPTYETKKVNTSVQCGTQVEDLDHPDYMISELGGSDARMSVSI